MRNSKLALAGATLLVGLSLAACGGSTSSDQGMNVADMSAMGSVVAPANDGDIAFAQLMIPHHQQAVEMADMALAHGVTGDVLNLANQIKAAQDPEIAQMTAWLAAWGAPLDMASSDGMSGMDMGGASSEGMMSADDMAALDQASGVDFDTMWMQMMIKHHEGAISMANQVLSTTSNADVKTLAEAVVSGQTAEIETMQKLLGQ
ncbi:MAG: DUF305 domain-containing protein [bacterium]|nr:DUF305 domain-containing protein [bacterium]